MKICHTVSHGRKRQSATDHPIPVKSAQHLPPGLRSDYEQRDRFNLQIFFGPNFALQPYALVKLRYRFAFAYDNPFTHRTLPAACLLSFLARSQNLTISGRSTTASSLPRSRARRSISRNRAANFAFAFFNAISGS